MHTAHREGFFARAAIAAAALVMAVLLVSCSTSQGGGAPASTPTSSSAGSLGLDEAGLAARAHTWGERLQVAKVRCLREAGWDATLDTDFSITGRVPPSQRTAFEGDLSSCESQYEDEFPRPVLTTLDLRKMYDRELATVKCLEKQGVPPASDPISEQQYIEEMQRQGFTSWRAYDAVPREAAADFAKLEKACPQPGSM